MKILTEYKTCIVCAIVVLLIIVVCSFVKIFCFPVPNAKQIEQRISEYVNNEIKKPVRDIIYSRDYGNISQINSWRVDFIVDSEQKRYTIRFHPITGKIISVEEIEM